MIQCTTAWVTDAVVFYMDVVRNKLPLLVSWKSRPNYFWAYLALYQSIGFGNLFSFLFQSRGCPLRMADEGRSQVWVSCAIFKGD